MSGIALELDTCGCCQGIRTLTPGEISNPPGLDRIAYRTGTHGSFKRTMTVRISALEALRRLDLIAGEREAEPLRPREPRDVVHPVGLDGGETADVPPLARVGRIVEALVPDQEHHVARP